ncbi:Outer membrane protein beta-barrel domain-containing protein [Chryseobacterium soldanellicola]|uniref:Outer membrane protein beta-barrel domain-containing protein n=1 Tax=Chryseobacterium soldanellicola TaxID=311333 RepID=A0A1H1GF16_9FLAO|nr:porin family protein [Chryseobacterium soldanellicola]SDR11436.1 Outer membrane protein beta-barrel domain-containing protein [Chryseobacterium soldanellicola]
MKNLILGVALVAGSFTFAQKATSKSITYGVKAGLNVASVSKDNTSDSQSSKVGFNVGAFANIPVATSFSVQPEVLFSQYGSKYDKKILGHKFSYANNLNYIAVPVMLQYNALPNLYLEAGPEFGFLVGSKVKIKDETANNVLAEGKADVKSFNLGLGLGAGYYFTQNIGVTVRYVAGLTDIQKTKPVGSDSVKNNVFQVGVAYKF